MWSAYADDDQSRSAEPDETATPGLAPPPPAGLDPIVLVVGGERFVVTRRPGSPGTYDFSWTTHADSYGFTVSAGSTWRPGPAELGDHIRSFLSEIDTETGYLPD